MAKASLPTPAVSPPASAGPGGAPGDDGLLYETETWFVRRGLPYFIEDYKATDDVFTKALPLLIVYSIANLMVVLSLHLTPIERVAGAGLGVGLLCVTYLVRNLISGRSTFAVPERIGWIELTGFIAIPPIVDYAVRHKIGVTVADLCVDLGVVLAIYVFTSALLPLGRWAIQRTFQELGETFDLAARALPLLFLFNSFLFISKDVWEFAADMGWHRLWAVVALFGLFTVLFLLYRLPEEVRKVAAHDDRMSIASACTQTPMDGVYDRIVLHEGVLPLNRAQRINILMILFIGQMLQVVLLAVLVWLFFLGFGAVTLTGGRIDEWTGSDKAQTVQVLGHALAYHGFTIDYRLVAVSVFLAAVSGFFFAVSSLTDEAYKDQFFARMNRELETAIQVRRVYVALYQGRHADDGSLGLNEAHIWERIPRFHHEQESPEEQAIANAVVILAAQDDPVPGSRSASDSIAGPASDPSVSSATGSAVTRPNVPIAAFDGAHSLEPQAEPPGHAHEGPSGEPHEHRRWFDHTEES